MPKIDDMLSQTTAVILAGGKGTRMQSTELKQFMDLNGKKVVDFSIEIFLDTVAQVVVVLPSLEHTVHMPSHPNIIYTEALASRAESLLAALSKVKTKYVLLHDSARPFVDKDVISRVVQPLETYAATCAVMPLSSSVVLDNNGELDSTPDRSSMREVQTPQGFQLNMLRQALEEKADQHLHIPELVRLMGHKVKHVEGSQWLFKITYQPSIYAARDYLYAFSKSKEQPKVVA